MEPGAEEGCQDCGDEEDDEGEGDVGAGVDAVFLEFAGGADDEFDEGPEESDDALGKLVSFVCYEDFEERRERIAYRRSSGYDDCVSKVSEIETAKAQSNPRRRENKRQGMEHSLCDFPGLNQDGLQIVKGWRRSRIRNVRHCGWVCRGVNVRLETRLLLLHRDGGRRDSLLRFRFLVLLRLGGRM